MRAQLEMRAANYRRVLAVPMRSPKHPRAFQASFGLNAAPVLIGADEWRQIAANAQIEPRVGV